MYIIIILNSLNGQHIYILVCSTVVSNFDSNIFLIVKIKNRLNYKFRFLNFQLMVKFISNLVQYFVDSL